MEHVEIGNAAIDRSHKPTNVRTRSSELRTAFVQPLGGTALVGANHTGGVGSDDFAGCDHNCFSCAGLDPDQLDSVAVVVNESNLVLPRQDLRVPALDILRGACLLYTSDAADE